MRAPCQQDSLGTVSQGLIACILSEEKKRHAWGDNLCYSSAVLDKMESQDSIFPASDTDLLTAAFENALFIEKGRIIVRVETTVLAQGLLFLLTAAMMV